MCRSTVPRYSPLLRDAEVAMLLAVFESSMTLQVHAERLPALAPLASTKVCTQPKIKITNLTGQALTLAITPNISKILLE